MKTRDNHQRRLRAQFHFAGSLKRDLGYRPRPTWVRLVCVCVCVSVNGGAHRMKAHVDAPARGLPRPVLRRANMIVPPTAPTVPVRAAQRAMDRTRAGVFPPPRDACSTPPRTAPRGANLCHPILACTPNKLYRGVGISNREGRSEKAGD
jgi:hypothetical protein